MITPFRKRRIDGDEAGFTLIEVMIAFVIMGIGLLTIALAQLTAIRMTTRSKQTTQAVYLAQEQLELFQAIPPTVQGAFVDPGNPIDIDPNDRDMSTFNRSWNVTLNTPVAGVSTVQIIVAWNNAEGGANQSGIQQVTLNGVVGP